MSLKPLEQENVILQRIANGERTAFSILFKHYNQYVHLVGKRLTKSDLLAEELVQDVFLKIWLKRGSLSSIENFGAYLNRMVRNQSFNVLRKMALERMSTDSASLSENIADHSTLQAIEMKELSSLLQQALEGLTEQQRKVYELCHMQGLKYKDAAHELGVSYETIHSHMKEAVKKIRIFFASRGISYMLLFIALFEL